jgi:hypothetical protein
VIEARVRELKEVIAGHDGENAADRRFVRAVDELIAAVYDEIGTPKAIASRALFDLFVIKVLYVGRHSRHADVIEYLGAMLDRYLDVRELFPPDEHGRPRQVYFSDMLDPERRPLGVTNVFEAYRRYADSALFLAGVFRPVRRRPSAKSALRRRAARAVDAAYFVSTGRTAYRMAARDDHADCEHEPRTLARLAEGFEVYVDALNEMSDRYLLGFDLQLIGDKMLDAFNRHRETGDARHLDDARRYAEILRIERGHFPGLFD